MRSSRPKRKTLLRLAAAVIFRVLSRKRQPHAKLKRKAKTVRDFGDFGARTLVPDTVMIDFERYLKTASGTLVPDTVRTLVPDTVMIDFEHYLKTASGKAFARERLLRT
jgi:hypothetical protein